MAIIQALRGYLAPVRSRRAGNRFRGRVRTSQATGSERAVVTHGAGVDVRVHRRLIRTPETRGAKQAGRLAGGHLNVRPRSGRAGHGFGQERAVVAGVAGLGDGACVGADEAGGTVGAVVDRARSFVVYHESGGTFFRIDRAFRTIITERTRFAD